LALWHCILSAELTKIALLHVLLAILPTGYIPLKKTRMVEDFG